MNLAETKRQCDEGSSRHIGPAEDDRETSCFQRGISVADGVPRSHLPGSFASIEAASRSLTQTAAKLAQLCTNEMPSSYKVQRPAEPRTPRIVSVTASPGWLPATQKKRTTLHETYFVASTCRIKLGREADRADHQLRLLVGHANLLDMLMEEMMDAEKGEERRLNALIRAAPKPQQTRKVQWIDTITEELEESEDSDSDDDPDGAGDPEGNKVSPIRPAKSPLPRSSTNYIVEDEQLSDEYETNEDDGEDDGLTLRRWPSKGYVPELISEGDSGSEDEDASASSQHHVRLSMSFSQHCSIAVKDSRDDMKCLNKPSGLTATIVGHA